MKTGVVLFSWVGAMDGKTPSSRDVVELAKLSEEVGLDAVWITDHFFFDYADFKSVGIEFPAELHGVKAGAWECWALVSAIAVATNRITIGTLVSSTSFRNPALLARTIDTVDDLSNGRLIVGLGAGDFPFEHRSFGYPFDRPVARFEEAIAIISGLLKGQKVSFDGEFYKAEEAELIPKGPRPDGPPLLIGSVYGRPRMSRLTIQYADYWNCFLAFGASTFDRYEESWSKLLEVCNKFDRDPATLKRNVTLSVNLGDTPFPIPGATPISGTIEEVASILTKFSDEGIEHCTVILHPFTRVGIEKLGRVVENIST